MNQSSHAIDADQEKIEPQNEATAKETLQTGAEQKKFAHDINYKIDQLEENIDTLAQQYNFSEDKFKQALGDISSRTAVVTQEIEQVNEQMLKADVENKDLVSALDARLKRSLNKLSEELGGIDSQISIQQTTLQSIRSDLRDSSNQIDARINALEESFQNKLNDLSKEQDKQSKTQQVFSESLDTLETKSNQIADELYATQVESATQQRIFKKQFTIGVSLLAAAIAITAGVGTYIHWSAQEYQPTMVSNEIDTKVNALQMSVQDKFVSRLELQSNSTALSSKIAALQTRVSDTATNIAIENQATSETLEVLASKVASLQLSLYGPEDSSENAVTPQIPVMDADWISAQPAENYSIQLVGVYRERSMMSFVNQYQEALKDHPVAFNVSKYRGQNWYNVIYGNFESFSEAQAALDILPADLQRNSPWVREMGSIQRTAIQ